MEKYFTEVEIWLFRDWGNHHTDGDEGVLLGCWLRKGGSDVFIVPPLQEVEIRGFLFVC